uniref:Uncharacterized protein n=1 Tax=Lepeophtheirus salmonis TaxID=72036 RepID=A0A0K2SVW3_LEPSM
MYDVWSTSYPVPEKREEEAVEEGTFHVCFGLQNFCFIILTTSTLNPSWLSYKTSYTYTTKMDHDK